MSTITELPAGPLLSPVGHQKFQPVPLELNYGDIFSDPTKGVTMDLPEWGEMCDLTMPVHVS